jgi:rhomboid protease GluP
MQQLLIQFRTNIKITYIILIVNIVIWLTMELAGGSTNPEVLIRYGAFFTPDVRAGEWWRMISSAFLHIGLLHLLVNSYALIQLGTFIEDFFGPTKLIATYVLTALSASLLSVFFTTGISAGASGALFGLIGLLLGNSWAKKIYTVDLPIDERQLIPFVILNLWFGFAIPGINNWAHIGGLIGGIILGFVFDPALSFDPSPIKTILPNLLGKISLILLALTTLFWFLAIWGIHFFF